MWSLHVFSGSAATTPSWLVFLSWMISTNTKRCSKNRALHTLNPPSWPAPFTLSPSHQTCHNPPPLSSNCKHLSPAGKQQSVIKTFLATWVSLSTPGSFSRHFLLIQTQRDSGSFFVAPPSAARSGVSWTLSPHTVPPGPHSSWPALGLLPTASCMHA